MQALAKLVSLCGPGGDQPRVKCQVGWHHLAGLPFPPGMCPEELGLLGGEGNAPGAELTDLPLGLGNLWADFS